MVVDALLELVQDRQPVGGCEMDAGFDRRGFGSAGWAALMEVRDIGGLEVVVAVRADYSQVRARPGRQAG